jgi:hypothetical protein
MHTRVHARTRECTRIHTLRKKIGAPKILVSYAVPKILVSYAVASLEHLL